MIRENSAIAAIGLAEELDRRGMAVIPKTDSLLVPLHTSATIDYHQPTYITPGDYVPSARQISDDSIQFDPRLGDRSEHDECLDDVVTMIADAVRPHISFARNTVRPLVKEYVERVEIALQNRPEQAAYNPEVIRVSLPEPMANNVFEGLVHDYREETYRPISPRLALPSMSGEEVAALLVTGNPVIDNDTSVWVQRIGVDFLATVWGGVFTAAAGSKSYERLVECPVTGDDAALVCFLAGKRLLDNPPEGVQLSLNDYRLAIGELIEQSGLRLCHAYDRQGRQEKEGHLILSHTRDAVRVNAAVYDQWSARGGKPAALFGNLLSERPRYFAPGVDENADEFVQTWERHNATLTQTLQARRFLDTVAILKDKATALIADHMDTCFENVANTPCPDFSCPVVMEAQRQIGEYLDTLTLDDLSNLWKIGTTVVAGKIFYYTDAKKILEGVDAALSADPTLEPSEAAIFSVIDYVVDFLVDQVDVVDL